MTSYLKLIVLWKTMRIEKKAWPELFQDVLEGSKKFDVRIGDFACSPGDILVLREWDPATGQYTGREIEKVINYVMKTKDMPFYNQEQIDMYGFVIVGIE